MPKKIDIEQLDAQTLYQMAREKEEAENRAQREANRERLKELRAERRAMLARHKKELANMEQRIDELQSKIYSGKSSRAAASLENGSSESISARLIEIIQEYDEMETGDIRARAEELGIDTKNISQTLSYLKRTGRLESPRRGVYATAA